MTGTTWAALRQILADHYDEFRKRLTRHLGSEDLARETLHETWVHLHRNGTVESVQYPFSYLLRTALNIGTDRRRKESRLARRFEVRAVLDMADHAPSAEEEAEARGDIAALERALEELTPRRRTILLAARLDGMRLREIADHLGISQRLVEIELKHAVDQCAERLGRRVVRRFGPRPRETSQETDQTMPVPARASMRQENSEDD
jgi:RNA polymerase sigma factor (sigma-70 family)